MSNRPQNRFPRLAIVGPKDKKPRQRPAGPGWWSPQGARGLSPKQAPQTPSRAIRMAVMPTLTRNLWFVAIAWMWNFLRGYFVTGTERQRGAAVLSFRRPVAQEGFASKKTSGSVRWNGDCEVAPQEGGGR
jgi:hypothetical protein